MSKLKQLLAALTRSESDAMPAANGPVDDMPFSGYTEHRVATKYVDGLSDEELRELNSVLRWNCFTVDQTGRRFGSRAWSGKRDVPQAVPDRRIAMLEERLGLRGKHVLEVGCFEGVHTVGLSMFAARVTAIDSRIENVVKTLVRCGFFGVSPTVFKCDLESAAEATCLPEVDILHHVGVLYHLVDPVTHLIGIIPKVREGIMLDTHVAPPHAADQSYDVGGQAYSYKRAGEGGRAEVFSGMGTHAKWLTLETICALLTRLGLSNLDVVESREERNGPRVLLFARRSA